ncbi:uncharacterized protein LOC129581836 [Paramacrobiotus metropolitanus]|uniref:uncharacterized protein LOC129581836 n=1 Tax=Paramacrobiotus metropolitanus TaxID=2943436 RepID=UPI0024463B3C|nr:uncharacterized protein LOC129581836 [Paramacrobiotus metropolitanus]
MSSKKVHFNETVTRMEFFAEPTQGHNPKKSWWKRLKSSLTCLFPCMRKRQPEYYNVEQAVENSGHRLPVAIITVPVEELKIVLEELSANPPMEELDMGETWDDRMVDLRSVNSGTSASGSEDFRDSLDSFEHNERLMEKTTPEKVVNVVVELEEKAMQVPAEDSTGVSGDSVPFSSLASDVKMDSIEVAFVATPSRSDNSYSEAASTSPPDNGRRVSPPEFPVRALYTPTRNLKVEYESPVTAGDDNSGECIYDGRADDTVRWSTPLNNGRPPNPPLFSADSTILEVSSSMEEMDEGMGSLETSSGETERACYHCGEDCRRAFCVRKELPRTAVKARVPKLEMWI